MIGQKIKELRVEKDLTQRQLADLLGLTPKMISFYELGQRMPPSDIIIKLSSIFNVSTDYLLNNKSSYYVDPEVSKIANEMKNNPDLRVLFDASKGLSKESIKEVENFIKFQKMKEGD